MSHWPTHCERCGADLSKGLSIMSKFIDIQGAEMVFNTKKGRFHALRDIHLELADLNREAVDLAAKIQTNFEELGV